jgi:hypothetical protein
MSRRLNIALFAPAAVTAATWSLPAAANGQQPDASVSERKAAAPAPRAKRTAVRKRIASVRRVPAPVPRAVPYTWFAPRYEQRIAVYWPVLLGVGF